MVTGPAVDSGKAPIKGGSGAVLLPDGGSIGAAQWMERGARVIIAPLVVVVVLLAAAVIAVYYWYQGQTYVTSNDAQVTTPMAPVIALGTGTLTAWTVRPGQNVAAGQSLGTLEMAGFSPSSTGAAPMTIVAPISGTVVDDTTLQGEAVLPGTTLAYVADLSSPSITAYIRETDIRNVSVGEPVDVRISAFPGSSFSGSVLQVGQATAATFSLLPPPPQSGDFTKVVQRIPVVISLSNVIGGLAPGESAWVRIHIGK